MRLNFLCLVCPSVLSTWVEGGGHLASRRCSGTTLQNESAHYHEEFPCSDRIVSENLTSGMKHLLCAREPEETGGRPMEIVQ